MPATFQHFINYCFLDYLDIFCTVYFTDIVIYSDTLEEYQVPLEKLLEALQRNGVLRKRGQYEYFTQSTT